MTIEKIHITMGLPGSGKTYWADEYIKQNREDYKSRPWVIHMDDYMGEDHKYRPMSEIMADNYVRFSNELIIDGLFLDNMSIIYTLKDLSHELSDIAYRKRDIPEVIVHVWNVDREMCLHNDQGRRSEHSEITIRNARVEYLDIALLNDKLVETGIYEKVTVQYHEVQQSNSFTRMFGKYIMMPEVKNGIIYTDSWSKGGTYGTCWSDDTSPISPDAQPDCELFDEIMEQVCPDIRFLDYKKIYKWAVTVDEWEDHDYYGGCEYRARYAIDLNKIHAKLEELKLV